MQVIRQQSGLAVVEHSMDEQAVQRQLKQINDRLILWPPDATSPYYRVVFRVSDDQPVIDVCAWMDDYGRPLPLSSSLIDKVNRLRPDAPNKGLTVDEHNDRHRARVRAQMDDRTAAVMQTHRAKVERDQTSVSFAQVGRKPYWMRNRRPPQHGLGA